MTDLSDATDPNPADDPAGLRKQIKELNEKLRERDAKISALERDSAFSKAGIPDSKLGEIFRKGYDGEIDVESIRSAATEAGILAPADPEPPTTPQEEQEAHTAIDELTAQPPPADPATEKLVADAAAKGPEALDALMRAQGLTGD